MDNLHYSQWQLFDSNISKCILKIILRDYVMSHGLNALKNSHLKIFDKAFRAWLYHEQHFISVTIH